MKKLLGWQSVILLAIVMCITAIFLTSCNDSSSSDKVEDAKAEVAEANKDLDEANEEYLADMQTYKTEIDAKIAANELSIKEFNARISTQKKEAKAEYKQKIAELEQKNTDMKKKLEGYKADGKENWANFKTEFNHDMDELGKALNDFTVKSKK